MKTILFKLRQFPHLSETFIMAQIITAIKSGFKVNILVSEILDFEESTHQEVLDRYKIREKLIIEDYKLPKNRLIKAFWAGILILQNITVWKQLLFFIREKGKFSLSWVYQFHFYRRFRNTDIIHIQYGTNIHPVDILKSAGGLKGRLIVSFHGHDAFFPINGFIPNNGYYKYLFRGDNLIVANTPYLAEKIRELGCPEENLRTIPVGVDTGFFNRPKKRPNGDVVKFINVGRLDRVKGQEWGIRFIYEMRQMNYDVQLTIIGDGNEKENLYRQIKELGLEESVFLEGKKSQDEVKEYLHESDVYLITAVPLEDGRRETQGLATLEAEACGLPVLAFNSGGVKYTIEENKSGFLCDEYDMDCLVEKAGLMMDKGLREKMGGNAKEFVGKKFSQDMLEKMWEKLYKDV